MAYPKQTPKLPFLESDILTQITVTYEDIIAEPSKLQHLTDKYGIIIVTNLADNCSQLAEGIKQSMLAMINEPKLNHQQQELIWDIRDGYKKWNRDMIVGIPSKGYSTTKGMPQSKGAWAVRKNPKVREIFGLIHQTDPKDLAVSNDVVYTNMVSRTSEPTSCCAHVTQNDAIKVGSKLSVQGVFHLTDCLTSDTANTAVWIGSHHEEIYRPLQQAIVPNTKTDHEMYLWDLPEKLKDQYHQGWIKHARQVPVPAGAMLLFNSRCIHQCYNTTGGYRVAVPISWEPKSIRDQHPDGRKMLINKLRQVLQGQPTTHWGSLGITNESGHLSYRGKVPMLTLCPEPLRTDLLRFNHVQPAESYKRKGGLYRMSLKQLKNLIKPEYLEMM